MVPRAFQIIQSLVASYVSSNWFVLSNILF